MPTTPLNTILSWYETGDFPTQDQFTASWSSFYHKDESIPMDKIENLTTKLQNKTDKSVYDAHLTNTDAHINTLAKLNASNLNQSNKDAWKTALGVGELPTNIATVDDAPLIGNVYDKGQSYDMFIIKDEFLNGDGKILASKIEALGLTELISVTENSLSAFMVNNANYTYERNDFIAIPNGSGNYSLYIYKGGSKTVSGNYLPTGLTNITIAMVEGLQAALDAKMSKPSSDGSFIAKTISGVTTWQNINPTASYLTVWNNGNFAASPIYTDGTKLGVGTTSPTEMLHLNNGRIRTKAIVFDENTENLPFQITCDSRSFYGSDSTGSRKKLMYQTYSDYLTLISAFTTVQKEAIGAAWNNQYSNGALNVYSITPTVMKNDHVVRYLVLQGLNLNVNPANTSVKFIPVGNAIGTGEIDCLGFQTFADGKSMIVSVYGDSLQPNTQYNLMIRTSTPTTQTHRTTSSINVVANIDNIDVSAIAWETRAYTAGQEGNIFAMNGGLFAYNSNVNNKAYAYEPNLFVGAAKSSVLFGLNKNFYLEINMTLSQLSGNSVVDTNDFYGYLGLLQNNIPITLTDNSFIRVINSSFRSGGYHSVVVWNNQMSIPTKIEPGAVILNANIVIMRQGNIYTQFLTVGSTTIIQSITSTTEAISLSLAVTNGTTQKSISGSIVQAFTF